MNTSSSSSAGGIGLAGLIIMFWGEPDLCDSLIQFFLALAKHFGG